ncbi:MAG: twitching motility protein PilT [Candidatus Muproteobacteria bacterium RIFCSPHIGHO2_01_FULL_65_16]|uniref:Twitching motility protein PilT n=1 Tax=Candidatus Muproteobacteria bacterium RIFCSPHIGHO2_01_FULL_65_16 TaxID=1817764 RepID=A0A1F6THZ7_9PROT|nr:MAG: twitching motility protein PilT [Candidatus Muproteobacteria bacterium RIFCSPHIGHO2_01_FULL_65_16]
MRVLLDTHILLWWLMDDRRLPKDAERIIRDPDNSIFVSAASIWEVAIKASLGQIEADPFAIQAAIEPSGFAELPITGKHAAQVARLPPRHRDPFDRMLVAQSLAEPMRLLTSDTALAKYGDIMLMV